MRDPEGLFRLRFSRRLPVSDASRLFAAIDDLKSNRECERDSLGRSISIRENILIVMDSGVLFESTFTDIPVSCF